MKRSDALEEISAQLIQEHPDKFQPEEANRMAKIILKQLEFLGMLPPDMKDPLEVIHQWEPEEGKVAFYVNGHPVMKEDLEDPMQVLADEAQRLKLGYETEEEDPDDDNYCGAV